MLLDPRINARQIVACLATFMMSWRRPREA